MCVIDEEGGLEPEVTAIMGEYLVNTLSCFFSPFSFWFCPLPHCVCLPFMCLSEREDERGSPEVPVRPEEVS